MNKLKVSALAAIATSILVACGGGKSSSDSTSITSGPVKLTGVVSTGSPTANPLTTTNKVTAKCLNASGGATQSVVSVLADGSYEVTLADSSLPCVLQVDTPQKMASLAQGTGPGTAVANITPVTTLVVAKVAGKDPVQFFAEFGAGTAAVITKENVNAAITVVRDVVAKAGVSLTGVVNVFTETVDKNASLSSTPPYDLAVAKLAETIRTAGITLEIVSVDVSTLSSSSSGSNAVAATSSGVASLPADRLLKPAAPTCTALRSGVYRSIDPQIGAPGSNGEDSTTLVTVDAVALTASSTASPVVSTLIPHSTDACRFTIADAGAPNGGELVVSPAGVIVLRESVSGNSKIGLAFPEQSLSLSDLAGTWNGLVYAHTDPTTTYQGKVAKVVIDAAGKFTAANVCADAVSAVCVDVDFTGLSITLAVNPAGGFTRTSTGPNPADNGIDRVFAYRAGSGEMMLVFVEMNGGISVATRQRTLALPAAATVNKGWYTWAWGEALANTSPTQFQLKAGSLVNFEDTIIASPAASASNSFTVSRFDSFGSGATHNETAFQNQIKGGPRTGYTWEESQSAGGGTVYLPLQGMGVNVFYFPSDPSIPLVDTTGYGFEVVNVGGASTPAPSTPQVGMFVVPGGATYALRANFFVDGSGQITGGNYDTHTTAGTTTPCAYSSANAATCFGTSSDFNNVTQGASLNPVTGASSTSTLSTGVDIYGFSFTGTITGKTWTGTWTKVDPSNGSFIGSGTFSVNVTFNAL